MIMFRGGLCFSRSFFQFYKLAKHAEYRVNQIICRTRLVCNSGCLIAGCCFSRQSEEEILLPKNDHDFSDNQTAYNLNTQSTDAQVINFRKMKRSCKSPDNITPQHANENSDQLTESSHKRLKSGHTENDFIEEGHTLITPTNENLDLPKAESVKSDRKKLETGVEKPKKQRPNYFIAIKISDTQINKTLSELQQHMLETDGRLKKSMIQLATLHITLMVMYIGDTETHARALKTLENIHQEHNDDLSKNPLKLEFKGLGHFQNRVVFAKLSEDDSYKRLSLLAESVRKHYTIASICSTDSRTSFTPHLTVAKIKDAWKKKVFPKKIDPLSYKGFNDQYFGSQVVQSIQLLSMTDPKDEAGYYAGDEIYFSAFEPKVRRDCLNKLLQTEKKKKDVKEMINALMQEKLK